MNLKNVIYIFIFLFSGAIFSQEMGSAYKKKVLDAAEVESLFSYYDQKGDNAAVTGGEGTEKLSDATANLIVKLPLNADDILTVDIGISAYTSASSSNINPLDGSNQNISPFNASSGASSKDALIHFKGAYSHSSDDRNSIWGANIYYATEYDYSSIGFGGNYAMLFNEKNTEVSLNGQVYLDQWKPQYPIELRGNFFDDRITGNGTYTNNFNEFSNVNRNSYSLSLGLSQILGKRLQGSLFADVIVQDGLLSTPHQRVYFSDVDDFFIDDFQLADDVEKLPNSRVKYPVGGRLNYYLNDKIVLRSYYRLYNDNWGITSHTASLEVPAKLNDNFTIYPNYRYYTQSRANYFYPKEIALSNFKYYTSDYDLSNFDAHQYGIGIRYKDLLANTKILGFGLKSLDLRGSMYNRSTGLDSFIVSFGTVFVYSK